MFNLSPKQRNMPSKSEEVESPISSEIPSQPKQKMKRKRRGVQLPIRQWWQNTAYFFSYVTQPRPLRHSYLFWFGITTGISSGTIALAVCWYNLDKSMPDSVDGVLTYAREGTLTITAADGTILQQVGDITHEELKVWQIPDHLKQAFIASEDSRFYQHGGIDFQGILRAALSNLQAGKIKEGGSTITQQLTRIAFLNQERKIWRKLREMRIAVEVEQEFDKDIILERYLNLVYLGSEAYGVADAAWVYFSKSVDELTIAEAAMIAGLTPAPSLYSPLQNPQAAKSRRDLVLRRMQQEGFISESEANQAIATAIQTQPSRPQRFTRTAPYFTEYIQEELPKYVDPKQIAAGGLTVETTLNPKWQKEAEKAIERTLRTYGRYDRFKQGSLVAIDPRNGQIKAMVGGRNFYDKKQNGHFNRATQAKRQPGSTFKTFVYTTAIAAGFSPYRGFRDAEYVVDGYKPRNFGDKYRNDWVSMRDAVISSINVVALRTLISVGWEPTIEIAKKMGIESNLNPTYSLALGAYEVNLLELTSAYGTLANRGTHQPAYGISRVLNPAGDVIYQADFQPVQAVDEETAAIMTWMLRGVVTSGTGSAAQIGRPAAGKTGTSDKARDLWFVGYIPQLVTGVWFGNDDYKQTWGSSSSAAATWGRFVRNVKEDIPVESFARIPRLQGREGIIEAEPIKPKRSRYLPAKSSKSKTTSKRRRSSSTRSRSRSTRSSNRSSYRTSRRSSSSSSRSRSYRSSNSQPRRTRSSSAPRRRAAPAPKPAPVAVPAPAAETSGISKPSKSKSKAFTE